MPVSYKDKLICTNFKSARFKKCLLEIIRINKRLCQPFCRNKLSSFQLLKLNIIIISDVNKEYKQKHSLDQVHVKSARLVCWWLVVGYVT